MALINFSGIASGIDSSSLITALLDQQRAVRITPLKDQISKIEDTNGSFGELKTLLTNLKDASSRFRLVNGGALTRQAVSSDETIVSASASNSATNGVYDLTVTQKAKNATASFNSGSTYTSASSVINSSIVGTDTVTIQLGATSTETVDVSVTNTTTLQDFVNSFNNNSSNTRATASLVNVGTSASPDYKIMLNSNSEGLDEGQITISSLGSTPVFSSTTISQATDAEFTLDGVSTPITRPSNTISDVIPGLTFSLQNTGNAKIAVTTDNEATKGVVQDFVDAYNEVLAYIAEQDRITQESGDDDQTVNVFGSLSNTSVDENIMSALRGALSSSGITGGTVNILADLGITTERDGSLSFNTETFDEALDNDSVGAAQILENMGERLGATDGTIAQFTRFNGIIDLTTRSNSEEITSLQNRISDAEKSLATQEQTLTQRFSRLEALIGQMNSQQQALSSILPR